MLRSPRTTRLVLLAAFALPASGCLSTTPCSSLVAILAKLGPNYNIGSLSACEWQTVFADLPTLEGTLGINLQGVSIPTLTDSQAQEIVDFLQAHNIQTLNELVTAYNNGSITYSQLPADLQALVNAL